MTENRKGVAFVNTLSKSGRALLATRSEIQPIEFDNFITRDGFRKLIADNPNIHALVLGSQPVSTGELAVAPKLEVVARVGVGYDLIDVPALKPRRIPLMIAGIANSPSVAEQAFSMLFHLAKRSVEQDALVREGRWAADRLKAQPVDIFEKTMLVVGCGRIGSRVVKRAVAMEMNVLVYDPFLAPEKIEALGAAVVQNIDDALPGADVVTLHCPRTPESMNLLDARRLALMKPSAYLINTARGGIVDEVALHTALVNKKLAGAGLDVLLKEPPPVDHPLLKLPNVVFQAHMAGVTVEAVNRMSVAAIENVFSVFDRRIHADNVVNKDIL